MKVDVDRLRFLAASLLEKNDIDWEAEHASAPDDVRSVLDHLEVIRQIAELHGTTTTSDQEQGTDPPEGFPPRWGHLRLLERIGHGTYGEVFRAWDENLDREVALKLLSQRNDDATADDALEEGKRLAKIQHANVVLVHGAERREGRVGIWMEFVRGRTLAAIVRDSGPFSAAEATLIGIDVCRAAAAVHAAGLLHCDIKARNIVRETGGRIVLLDLGAATPRTADTVSGAAGTPLYMAPEVLDGQPATTLSEIYCIGVVLFHLATGAYPAIGDTVEAIRAAHAGGCQKLADLRPDLPDGFVRVVERALSTVPSDRWLSAGAMEAALVNSLHPVIPRSRAGRWAIASAALVSVAVAIASAWAIRRNAVPTPAISSIAVLPFKDASATPKEPYLSDGLTDALINRLSAAQGLRVISSTSSMYYRDHPTLLSDVGRTLNVDAVVEGSIETSAQNVRLTARLIDPRSDRILWRKTLDESGANLAEALDALAGAIATEIQHELPEAARRRIDTSAYDAFLRGEYELAKRTPDALRNARRLFEQSIERDPEYARAHAALAEGYTLLAAFNVLPQDEGFPRARQAALESLRLDDRESMGHAVLGYVLFEFYADHDSGLRELQQALSLDPNNATARQWFALSLAAQERYGEAVYQIGQARETDPLSKMIASDAANVYRRAGQLDKAREELRRLLNLYPDFVEAHRELAFVDERLGDYRRAREEYKVGARQGRPEDFFLLGGLGYVNARLGDRSSAEEIFANLKRRLPKQPEAYASYILVGVALNRVRDVEAVLPVCRALGARCRPGLDRPEVQHVLDALGGT